MISRKFRCIGTSRFGFHQRANANENAQNIGAGWLFGKISSCGFQKKLDLILRGDRLRGGPIDRRVGCADHGMAMPRNQKDHSAVAGLWNNHRSIAREKTMVQDDMNALARCNDRFRCGQVGNPELVAEWSSRIDHTAGLDIEAANRFL